MIPLEPKWEAEPPISGNTVYIKVRAKSYHPPKSLTTVYLCRLPKSTVGLCTTQVSLRCLRARSSYSVIWKYSIPENITSVRLLPSHNMTYFLQIVWHPVSYVQAWQFSYAKCILWVHAEICHIYIVCWWTLDAGNNFRSKVLASSVGHCSWLPNASTSAKHATEFNDVTLLGIEAKWKVCKISAEFCFFLKWANRKCIPNSLAVSKDNYHWRNCYHQPTIAFGERCIGKGYLTKIVCPDSFMLSVQSVIASDVKVWYIKSLL